MRRQLDLQPFVPADILEITAHLDRRSPRIAARFIDRLASTFDWLTEHSEAGGLKSVAGLAVTDVRTWAADGFHIYLVVYRIVGDAIVVYGVLHGHRDIPAVLRFRI